MRALDNWADEDLLDVFGDPGFEDHSRELVRRREPAIRGIVRRRLLDPGLVEDAVSETWHRVLVGKNSFVPGLASVWINTIAVRVAIDLIRRASNSVPVGIDLPEPITAELGPEQISQQHELDNVVHQAITQLPFPEQAVLVLVRPGSKDEGIGLGQLTQQQVADLLGFCNAGAVNQCVRRALESLREKVSSSERGES